MKHTLFSISEIDISEVDIKNQYQVETQYKLFHFVLFRICHG